jgi:hypothetical protein
MKKNLNFLLIAVLLLFCYQIGLHAATITLKSGVVINGPLIDMTDDSVTIKDPTSNQPRNIKTVYIRDIILDPSEKKIGEKQKQKEKEKEAIEKAAKEKEAKDKAAKDKAAKDKEAKDKEAKDKEAKDKAAKEEKEAKEKAAKEKAAREEKEAKEKAAKEEKEVKGKDIKLRGTDTSNLLYQLDPELGLLPGIAYPFGKLGKAVKIGFGANLFSDVRVPIPQDVKGFQIRLGLSVGFLYHTTTRSDVSSTLMMLPITAYGKFLYNFDLGLRPYLKVGGGITPVMAGTTDMDPTVAFALGLGYINNKIPYLEFFVEAGMMMVFESVRGDFITAHVGVAYRFGAPQPTIKK